MLKRFWTGYKYLTFGKLVLGTLLAYLDTFKNCRLRRIMIAGVNHAYSFRPTLLCSPDGCPEHSLTSSTSVTSHNLVLEHAWIQDCKPKRVKESHDAFPIIIRLAAIIS